MLPLLLALMLPSAAAPPALPPCRGRALLVGVTRFDAEHALPNSDRSAEALASLLHGEYGLLPTVMTEERGKADVLCRPDSRRVRRMLEKLTGAVGKDDTVVFFFAGHGTQPRGEKDAQLVLSDTRQDEAGSGLLLSEVYALFAACKARQKLIVLDACRSPASLDLLDAKARVSVADLPSPPPGVAVLLSAAPGEISWQIPALGHGTFTYFLLKRWSEAAARGETVCVSSLFAHASRETARFTAARLGKTQRPQWLGRPGVDVVLAPPGGPHLRAGLRAKERRQWKEAANAFAAGSARTPRLLAERALARLERGDRKGGAEDAEKAMDAAPRYPLALRSRAEAHAAHGEMAAALALCGKALRAVPGDAAMLALRSRVRFSQGEFAAALDDVERAGAIAPASPRILLDRAEARDMVGLDGDAVEDARRVLALEPENARALGLLARLEEHRIGREEFERRQRRALVVLRAAFAADRASLSPRLRLANQLRRLRDYAEATKLLAEAEKTWPGDDRVLGALGELAEAKEDFADAAKRFADAAKLMPEESDWQARLSLALLRQGKKTEAREVAETGVKRWPAHPGMGILKGLLLREDDPRAALDECSRAVAACRSFRHAYQIRALLATVSGDAPSALADLATAGRLARINPELICERGAVLRQLGRFEDALAEFAKAEKLAPLWPRVHSLRGAAYAERRDHARAAASFARALALDPGDLTAYAPLGKQLYLAGRYEEAACLLARARARGAGQPDVTLYLGLSRILMGDPSPRVFGWVKEQPAAGYAKVVAFCSFSIDAKGMDAEIKARPDDHVLYVLRARVHLNAERWADALANADVVRRELPLAPAGHALRAEALAGQGKTGAAIAEYDRAIRLAPQQAHLWRARGKLHEQAGHATRAKADEEKAARLLKRKAK